MSSLLKMVIDKFTKLWPERRIEVEGYLIFSDNKIIIEKKNVFTNLLEIDNRGNNV